MNDWLCLPAADITSEIEGIGSLTTKVIVAGRETDMSYYKLGNETQTIFDKIKNGTVWLGEFET